MNSHSMVPLCLWLATLFGVCEPNDAATLWQEGNQAYEDGRYGDAVDSYEQLLQKGIHNGWIHFNLGNAYFRTGELGKAILHYHKAQYFLPNDEDVRQNLELATQKRLDPQIDEEKDSFSHTVDVTLKRVRYPYLFYSALFFLTLAGLASIGLILRREANRPLGYVLVICGVIGLLLAGTAKIQYEHLTRTDFAVVIAQKVNVLSGPSKRETVSFTIHEGIRCQILSETENWVRIRLANGYNGWIPKEKIERI